MRAAAALLLAALAAFADGAPAAGPAAAPSPSAVVDAFHDALGAGDRRKALELLTGDVRVFEQGRVEQSRTEYARRHLTQDIGFAAATRRTVAHRSVRVHGDVAWVTSVNRTRGRFRNRRVDLVTDETMILVRAGEGWRIAHIHWSFDDTVAH